MDSETSLPGSNTIAALKATLRKPNAIIVGAAIGTGMAAQAASRGGADFLLALNAGRIRSMGVPSILSLLALRQSNDFVMEFAKSEILPRAGAPVFFGACAFDPRQPMCGLIDEIVEAGFDGVANFPTAVFLDGRFGAAIDEAGVGFARELELLALARRRGLATLAYVRTLSEAERVAAIGVDIINVSLGWYVGANVGASTELRLDQASERAKQLFRGIRSIHPTAICLLEGGPIVKPEEMYRVCRASKANGYIGGSTIDRAPPEYSIEHTTSAFKAVGTLQKRVDELERELEYRHGGLSIVGRSAAIQQAMQLVRKLAQSHLPVLITGERGTGKKLFARAIHEVARLDSSKFVVPCDIDRSGSHLFGAAATGSNGKQRIGHLAANSSSTVLVEHVASLSEEAQERLAEMLETGLYKRLGDNETGYFSGRLIFAALDSLHDLAGRNALLGRLADMLAPGHIVLPPLRDRLEDLPLLCEYFLRKLRAANTATAVSVDHSVYRTLLSRAWPGNIRELRTVLETAAVRAEGEILLAEHLPAITHHQGSVSIGGEREWILDALRRHRFRRGEVARYLGISRKTLYNKMKSLRISTEA